MVTSSLDERGRAEALRRDGPGSAANDGPPEAASDAAFVYEVPSHLARLHRNGKITSNMVHAASRFHGDWVTAGLVGLRIAQLARLSGGGETDGLTGAVLDARNRIHRICDRLGGFNQPGF